ncbi:MAG TPA: hypothetical protein VFM43_01530 [Gaiellaceae bacterium]|nr:hypothetical protein [Gaiellaceae bacterium]
MLSALVHSVLAVETAAEQGRKVVLAMLAVGGIFLLVIAVGELSHRLRHKR